MHDIHCRLLYELEQYKIRDYTVRLQGPQCNILAIICAGFYNNTIMTLPKICIFCAYFVSIQYGNFVIKIDSFITQKIHGAVIF